MQKKVVGDLYPSIFIVTLLYIGNVIFILERPTNCDKVYGEILFFIPMCKV